ncbi:MAG: hypothetical protein J6K42_03515 [Clostridia bacterium]|nr:hypothetical protein [Clostridia bacterium]
MKKLGKVVLVLLILVLLGVVGYGGYYLYNQNEEANKKIGELENKIVIVSENKNEVNIDTTENTSNNQSDKYEKIVPKYYSDYDPEIFKSEYVAFLENSEYIGLGIDEIIKNSDETYTVRGTAVSMYKLNDDEIAELEKTGYVHIEGKKM